LLGVEWLRVAQLLDHGERHLRGALSYVRRRLSRGPTTSRE
jgi:hypothetical protein